MTDPLTLAPGPEMDAALCEMMEIEPEWGLVNSTGRRLGPYRTRGIANNRLGLLPKGDGAEWSIVPIYPALSTTDEGMGRVLDWLEQQGWYYQELRRANQSGPHWFCTLGKGDTFVDGPYSSTRFEAVGRAALLTKGERDGDG